METRDEKTDMDEQVSTEVRMWQFCPDKRCDYCNKDISHAKANGKYVTGCPHCNHSFVEQGVEKMNKETAYEIIDEIVPYCTVDWKIAQRVIIFELENRIKILEERINKLEGI